MVWNSLGNGRDGGGVKVYRKKQANGICHRRVMRSFENGRFRFGYASFEKIGRTDILWRFCGAENHGLETCRQV
jgi:hypothetical protein